MYCTLVIFLYLKNLALILDILSKKMGFCLKRKLNINFIKVINLATKIGEKTLSQAIFQDLDFREEYNNNDSFANFRNKVVKKGAATFQFPAFMAFVIIIL